MLRWREGAIRLPHGDSAQILGLGVIGFGCYQILWPVALQSIPAGDSALLIATTPVMTALLAMATGADTPERGQARSAPSCRSPAWRWSSPPARASTSAPRWSATC